MSEALSTFNRENFMTHERVLILDFRQEFGESHEKSARGKLQRSNLMVGFEYLKISNRLGGS